MSCGIFAFCPVLMYSLGEWTRVGKIKKGGPVFFLIAKGYLYFVLLVLARPFVGPSKWSIHQTQTFTIRSTQMWNILSLIHLLQLLCVCVGGWVFPAFDICDEGVARAHTCLQLTFLSMHQRDYRGFLLFGRLVHIHWLSDIVNITLWQILDIMTVFPCPCSNALPALPCLQCLLPWKNDCLMTIVPRGSHNIR